MPVRVYGDPKLGWAEKGLLSYIMGHPDKAEFSMLQAMANSAASEQGINELLDNIQSAGYIRRSREVAGDEVLGENITILKDESEKPAEVAADDPMFGFEQFWQAYPKEHRKAKKPCSEKWKTKRCAHRLNEILASLDAHKQSTQWLGGYVQNPLTWLNQERWNDEILG